MKEGAWINSQTGKSAWVNEHASWIQQEQNAKEIGLSDAAWERLKNINADFNGPGRVKILAFAMNMGLIRMRGHGAYWTFEFTIKTSDALWTCLSFADDYAGPYTNCRFNNLRTGEQIEMNYHEFKKTMQEDPERVMRIAHNMTSAQHPRRFYFASPLTCSEAGEIKIHSSLLHTAKPIPVKNRFVNVFVYLIEELFENRMYVDGRDDQRLADIVRRDLSYQINRETWESEGGEFERSGGLPLEGFYVTFSTDPNKTPLPGGPSPVIYSGGFKNKEDYPAWPRLFFTINGNLTKGEAMKQFDMSSAEYPNICTVVKHELSHAYDRQQEADMRMIETEDELEKDEVYFNIPAEVRAWTGNLIDEFHQFLLRHEGPVENRLVDAFLRGSRVWSLLNQHLNADNRRRVLHELSRELEAQKGHANAKPAPQVDHRGPVRR